MTDAFALMRACREAGETHGLRMVTAAVLLHMATYAKADGTGCHPAIRTVARRMNTSNKVVCRAVDELVAAGWLVEAGSAGRGCRVWRMMVPPVPVGNHSTGTCGEPVPEGNRSPWGTTTGPRGEPLPVPVGNHNNHGTTNELPSLKEHAPRTREAEADPGGPHPEGQNADRGSPPHSKPSPRQPTDSPESAQGAPATVRDARSGVADTRAGQSGAQAGAYAVDASDPVEGYAERFARLAAAAVSAVEAPDADEAAVLDAWCAAKRCLPPQVSSVDRGRLVGYLGGWTVAEVVGAITLAVAKCGRRAQPAAVGGCLVEVRRANEAAARVPTLTTAPDAFEAQSTQRDYRARQAAQGHVDPEWTKRPLGATPGAIMPELREVRR
jgi:hypothetical protein